MKLVFELFITLLHVFMTNGKIIFCLYCSFLGRLHEAARMYGEVFVNGVKSQIPYGSYVSALLFHLHSSSEISNYFSVMNVLNHFSLAF